MSRYMFITADFPLSERDFQRPEVIRIEIEGTLALLKTEETDPDFCVFRADEGLAEQVFTEKEFCYVLQYGKLSERCSAEIIQYIKENIRPGGEFELWNVWLGGDEDETSVEYWEVPVDELTTADIEEFDSCKPWNAEYINLEPWQEEYQEPYIERFTQYCMILK